MLKKSRVLIQLHEKKFFNLKLKQTKQKNPKLILTILFKNYKRLKINISYNFFLSISLLLFFIWFNILYYSMGQSLT